MASYENFFNGSEYPFEKPYGGFSAYHVSARDIAYPSDPLTANQLKKVSDKISSGSKTIEVSGLGLMGGGPMKHLASVPRQHWKEIDRLRKLTGVDLTFHGPLVDSSGFTGRGNWSEDQRKEAERQMKAAVELAQQMNSDSAEKNPKGTVMTFHSNNGLPEVKRKVVVGRKEDGTPIEQIVGFAVVNEMTGEIGPIRMPEEYFEKGKGAPFMNQEQISEWLKSENQKIWDGQLSKVAFDNNRARTEIAQAFHVPGESRNIKEIKEIQQEGLRLYGEYAKDPHNALEKVEESVKKYTNLDPEQIKVILNDTFQNLNDAEIFLRQSYQEFKGAFNDSYRRADQQTKTKLDKLRDQMLPVLDDFHNDRSKLLEFQNEVNKGIQELKSIGAPKFYKPLEEFAIDKGSETFANVALHAYTNAKAYNRAPGIISIENPPVGMSGLTRAEEIKALVIESRKKFVDKAVEQKIMSKDKAEEVSKQIIGATWDVGHINSIRKWGYNKEDVVREAKTIGPYVKHMHIADNLGFEDSELPAGMGNVPIDEILASNENFRKAKKVIETGDWYSRQGGLGMTHTPIREAFSGLTSPVYAMGQGPYWNEIVHSSGSYFSGIGPINPEVHHSIYGGGFSGLPAYLGGELPGRAANSSFSGAPLE